jgi:Tfp pilus assembly protein PilX
MTLRAPRQRGLALPIVLILLTVMLISSLYLVKSTTSTTLTTANLAYDSALSKAADLGLHTAFQYLSSAAKATLVDHDAANGYRATVNPAQSINSAAFWEGSAHVTDTAGNTIEYVIHRMCMFTGDYNSTAPVNRCTLTSSKSKVASATKLGESMSSDRSEYNAIPELHYVVTARIYGARGGNVVTQAVVMMGP